MSPASDTPRALADRYVEAVCDLDPITATSLGTRPGDDRLPDFSPAGLEAEAELDRRTLAELDALGESDDPVERRCARLLRERLSAQIASCSGPGGACLAASARRAETGNTSGRKPSSRSTH